MNLFANIEGIIIAAIILLFLWLFCMDVKMEVKKDPRSKQVRNAIFAAAVCLVLLVAQILAIFVKW